MGSSPYAINAWTLQPRELSAYELCQNDTVRKVSKTILTLRLRLFALEYCAPVLAIGTHDEIGEAACIGDAQTVRPIIVTASPLILPTVNWLPQSMPGERGIDGLGLLRIQSQPITGFRAMELDRLPRKLLL